MQPMAQIAYIQKDEHQWIKGDDIFSFTNQINGAILDELVRNIPGLRFFPQRVISQTTGKLLFSAYIDNQLLVFNQFNEILRDYFAHNPRP